MKMLKGFASMALGALIVAAVCFAPAEAAYKPKITSKMGGQAMKDVQKAVATLKAMPKPVRWTFCAEKLGLLFMQPNGIPGHDSNSGHMRNGSHFIGIDGMEYDAKAEYNARPSKEGWTFCASAIDRLGREIVFSKLSSEVTALVLENAKFHLDRMAENMPEMRDMYLAFIAKLCYLPGGKSPYDKLSTITGPHKQPIQFYEIGKRGCKFVNTQGVECDYDDAHNKYDSLCPGGYPWFILNVCTHHVGAKDILALYPDEVKKLRANYKKKMQELGVGANEEKEDKVEDTSEPSAKAESLAKKLGITYRPKTNADRMGGQYRKELNSVASYVKKLPKTVRWIFIAERMGLLFIPSDGQRSGHDKYGYAEKGSHYIGVDGLEYDARAEINSLTKVSAAREVWVSNSDAAKRIGHDAVFAQLPDEVAELVLQNAKYHLDKLAAECPEGKESVLARIAQLEYLPNGTSPYVLRPWKGPHGDMVNEYKMDAPWQKYYFTDTEGKKRLTDDAYRKIKGSWCVLIICAHHLGADAILALCPDEVKKLRANYEKRMKELRR
ncbi:MAG: hypothetical protein J1E42_05000 [Akkermansiaceae bacterium]|nr:hypothetical protein [Akkermansiaceae bacterium]